MKSPFTGGEAELRKEWRTLEYRKESFQVLYHYFHCLDSGEDFTTEEMDTLNINQVHNKYRERYGIPFPDEISETRERFGICAVKMSEVLGLGVNVYRLYEGGEMPTVVNGRMIRLAQVPEEFERLLAMSRNALEPSEYERVERKIRSAKNGWGRFEDLTHQFLFRRPLPDIYTGYRMPDLKRIGAMIHFFAWHNKPFTTALNKLMFYADFCHFRLHGHSISGIAYKALPKGPVPDNYGSIYNYAIVQEYAKIEERSFPEFVGEQFFADSPPDMEHSPFKESEWQVLNQVALRFKGKNTRQIVDISHEEPAWKDNVGEFGLINFEYSFYLKE